MFSSADLIMYITPPSDSPCAPLVSGRAWGSHGERVREGCAEKAVELSGGDSKSLVASGFAKAPPGRGKELLPDRERLPAVWATTACMSIKSGEYIEIRKAQTGASGCRGLLWRVADLTEIV